MACSTDSWSIRVTSSKTNINYVFSFFLYFFFSFLGQSDLCIVLFLLLLLLSSCVLVPCLWGWVLLLILLTYIVWSHYNLKGRKRTEWFNYHDFSGWSSCIMLFFYFILTFYLKFFKQNYKKLIKFTFFLQFSLFYEICNSHIDISVI